MQKILAHLSLLLVLLSIGSAYAMGTKAPMASEKLYQYNLSAEPCSTGVVDFKDLEIPLPGEKSEMDEASPRVCGQPLPCAALTILMAGFIAKLLKGIRRKQPMEVVLQSAYTLFTSILINYLKQANANDDEAYCCVAWQHTLLRL